MLTRLQVDGFKNLRGVDVRFGPLTCIAGGNGVGKSNLFDAILFLSALADKPFAEAARSIRGGDQNSEMLFSMPLEPTPRIKLAAEMLIPQHGVDDFGQPAEASATFVRYELELSLLDAGDGFRKRIFLEREDLKQIPQAQWSSLGFAQAKKWHSSVFRARGRSTAFISMADEEVSRSGARTVRLHADRMPDPSLKRAGGGQPSIFPAKTLPRTVLSSANNADVCRTAVLVRKEMLSWRLLQLEPSALRRPDELESEGFLAADGAHLAATLYRLSTESNIDHPDEVCARVANRLSLLVEGVRSLRVDRDDARKLLSVLLKDSGQLELPASSLSDGTMRFIALAVLLEDPLATGVLCLEEPENGINPERIKAIVELLYDIAVDTEFPLDSTNPLRQVIINTHSPLVAAEIDQDDLLFARRLHRPVSSRKHSELVLFCIEDSWRAGIGFPQEVRGRVLSFLAGIRSSRDESHRQGKRVGDYAERQMKLFSATLNA
jgi:predicted ATPase